MSKSGESENGIIWLLDEPSVTAKKIKSAVTDNDRDIRFDPVNKPGVSNLLTMLSVLGGESIPELETEFGGRGYGDLKSATAEAVVAAFAPVRERTLELLADPAELDRILADSADRADAIARADARTVYDRVGFVRRLARARDDDGRGGPAGRAVRPRRHALRPPRAVEPGSAPSRSRAYLGDDAAAARRWHALEEQHYHRYLAGELEFLGQRRARAGDSRALRRRARRRRASRWFATYLARVRATWQLHDDVLPCLDALAAPASVRHHHQRRPRVPAAKIARLGLDRRVEYVIATGAVGCREARSGDLPPACERFGVTAPLAAAYVGDRLRTDAHRRGGRRPPRRVARPARRTATDDDAAEASAAGVPVIRAFETAGAARARWSS